MPFRLCPTCGTFIEIGPGWERHYQSHRGRKANGRYGSTRQWRNTRAQILDRDGHRCTAIIDGRRCGREDGLEVHHLDGDYRNNEPGNLAVLCQDHHRQAEAA